MISTVASRAVLVTLLSVTPVIAQDIRVNAAKSAAPIPKACQSARPASIDGQIDIPALLQEANCKGSADALSDYAYTLTWVKREYDRSSQVKARTTVFEVYLPTLTLGTRARGVLLETSRDGIPVPPDELEKERLRVGKQLEQEEQKISSPESKAAPAAVTGAGMLPLGTYGSMKTSAGKLARSYALLKVQTFLTSCELTAQGREQQNGREMLVFSFSPRPGARFDTDEKYIGQLKGRIWIDAQDRIVTRLAAWPSDSSSLTAADGLTSIGEKPPAVFVEMLRTSDGVWLPRVMRINGMDYPKLFDHITSDSNLSYSEYRRFKTKIDDVKLESPKPPQ